MKIDNGHFYEIEPVVDLENFAELLLVTLALNRYVDDESAKQDSRKAELSINYKENIENAMYGEDDNVIKFLQLIDHYQYYEHQASWENQLAEAFKNHLQNNNKVATYNFTKDTIEVEYTLAEIDKILDNYDEETKNIMELFSLYIIDEPAFHRHNSLLKQQTKRQMSRKYIKTSEHNFCNEFSKG